MEDMILFSDAVGAVVFFSIVFFVVGVIFGAIIIGKGEKESRKYWKQSASEWKKATENWVGKAKENQLDWLKEKDRADRLDKNYGDLVKFWEKEKTKIEHLKMMTDIYKGKLLELGSWVLNDMCDAQIAADIQLKVKGDKK